MSSQLGPSAPIHRIQLASNGGLVAVAMLPPVAVDANYAPLNQGMTEWNLGDAQRQSNLLGYQRPFAPPPQYLVSMHHPSSAGPIAPTVSFAMQPQSSWHQVTLGSTQASSSSAAVPGFGVPGQTSTETIAMPHTVAPQPKSVSVKLLNKTFPIRWVSQPHCLISLA